MNCEHIEKKAPHFLKNGSKKFDAATFQLSIMDNKKLLLATFVFLRVLRYYHNNFYYKKKLCIELLVWINLKKNG